MLLGTQLVDLRRIERRYSVIRLADLHQIETSSDPNKIYLVNICIDLIGYFVNILVDNWSLYKNK